MKQQLLLAIVMIAISFTVLFGAVYLVTKSGFYPHYDDNGNIIVAQEATIN